MKVSLSTQGIISLEFPTQRELALTMCRMQEYYESPLPELRRKFFTLDSLLHHAMGEDGQVNYFHTWVGFNLPGDVFNSFVVCFAGSLSKNEQALLSVIRNAEYLAGRTARYIIAYHEGSKGSVILHEQAHAMWNVDSEYRSLAEAAISQIPDNLALIMRQDLRNQGYAEDVLTEEIHAYCVSESVTTFRDTFPSIQEDDISYIHLQFNPVMDKV